MGGSKLLSHLSLWLQQSVGVPWHTFGSNNLVLIMKPELLKNLHQAGCIPLTGIVGRRELVWALPQHLLCWCGKEAVSYCLPKSLCVQDTAFIISAHCNMILCVMLRNAFNCFLFRMQLTISKSQMLIPVLKTRKLPNPSSWNKFLKNMVLSGFPSILEFP